jgi:hypothetical protein
MFVDFNNINIKSVVYNIETREHCIIDALFQRKEQHVCPMKEFKINKEETPSSNGVV